MYLKLKRVLVELRLPQAALAVKLQLSNGKMMSQPTLAQIINHDDWPKLTDRKVIEAQIIAFVFGHGGNDGHILNIFKNDDSATGLCTRTENEQPQSTNLKESADMLLRKHTLTSAAKKRFHIPRDPFTDEMQCDADVFLSDDIRYVRATIRQTAKHGGMLAVIGESGAGKSTLRHDLIEWINVNKEPITVIEPYVLGLEDNDAKGKALKSIDIAAAVIQTIDPNAKPRRGSEARARQMHDMLRASAQTGRKHVLVIEEAHGLPIPTLKHLKRFFELQEGFKKLLAIVLIGQTELEWKLSEHNPEVREVVQRCELVKLPPLDNHVEAYLRHKFVRIEVDFDALFDVSAVDEIRNRLRISSTEGSKTNRSVRTQSLCYPLAVNNLVAGAMNEAVKIGASRITGELVAAAVRA
ncbi:ExeA family protein [Glaciimonas immobilis]|uniref:Type II secretory pathway predicted ATPase ExeA n=1 Tax=Glaciimonas immobilis TaxID=728004 RepID=A0A840RL14_9BURK|nr:AAA family ATPase [Glaciimonas immobilis]KAF3999036.1 AAA family ATPase [Glaciimonas immobilis]MBB5198463.1 type II secretory pathway predicted ATPase ExeA [Glaciimonas immobilis]